MVRYIHLTKSLHAEKNAFLYKVAEAFALLLFLAWLLTNKIGSPMIYTTACFFAHINNHQQATAHNVVVDKLNVIEKSFCEIRDNFKWFKPNNKHCSPKPTKSYKGDVLPLWNEFKQLFDAKRKLDISLSEICCKIKSKIEDFGKGIVGTSTLENFYMNPKPNNTLKLIASWVENERGNYREENCENE